VAFIIADQLPPSLRKVYDELPDALKPYLLALPPRITLKRAMEVASCSRGHLYDLAGAGKITILKSGDSHRSMVVVETVSLLMHMASMKVAVIKPKVRKAGQPRKVGADGAAQSGKVGG
jgi:hypothetical protein